MKHLKGFNTLNRTHAHRRALYRNMVEALIENENVDSMVKERIYESIDNFAEDTFRAHIEKMCHELDIPTPAILKSHIKNYVDFNNVVFLLSFLINCVILIYNYYTYYDNRCTSINHFTLSSPKGRA